MKQRLDQSMVMRRLVPTRSQAESYIKLGQVTVDGQVIKKPGWLIGEDAKLVLTADEQYVGRAALKLASVTQALKLNFKDKIVLDVGSSTGGFTDYALKAGARKVIAVEAGKDQLHPKLRADLRVELHEQTDIRDFKVDTKIDIVLADVSFVSLRDILPSVSKIVDDGTAIVVMVKPQFEAMTSGLKHKGVIKNNAIRRKILEDFELWSKSRFVLISKVDSDIAGAKGNLERFYLLRKLQ